ncbi:hypothetical protein BDR03DRAFT_967675 [Suillus americanus]|nr:hypothetical protein BDR03DRAFT_967675 [Suillus americanus]
MSCMPDTRPGTQAVPSLPVIYAFAAACTIRVYLCVRFSGGLIEVLLFTYSAEIDGVHLGKGKDEIDLHLQPRAEPR